MSVRIPLYTVIASDNNGEVGAGSVGGGVPINFNLPQDCDNIVVKFQASTVGAGVSAQLQTTDDGGTTWYAVARTSIVSNAIGVTAQWLSVPVCGFGNHTFNGNGVIGSVGGGTSASVAGTIGNASPSTLGMLQQTGLPILSQRARVILQITGDLTASSTLLTEVKVNSQSATA